MRAMSSTIPTSRWSTALKYVGLRRLACVHLGALLLAACATPPPQNARFAELTYGHLGKLRLEVSTIDVRSAYQPTLSPPSVEHLFPIAPEQVMRRWAADRLAATGAPGRRAVFTIRDARVIETKLARTQGIAGAFTRDQTERYDMTLEATLEIGGERPDLGRGTISAKSIRARTVSEGITVNERERIWYELLEAAMNDLNAELEAQIREKLALFLQ